MTRVAASLLLAGTVAATVACGSSSSPTAPSTSTSTTPPSPPPEPTRVIGLSGSLAYGDVALGQSATRTFTITNSGNSALAVAGLTLPAGYTANWQSGTVAAGASQEVSVQFAPTAPIRYDGTLTVRADQTSGTTSIDVSGAGAFTAGATSGTIQDLQVVRDIITFNQNAGGGASFRRAGYISRWELPIAVVLGAGIPQDAVVEALEHWRRRVGISYVLRSADVEPRILVRVGTDGVPAAGGSRGLVDGTYANNRARSGLVVVHPNSVACTTPNGDCRRMWRHELGHAIGIFDHPDFGGTVGSCVPLPPVPVANGGTYTACDPDVSLREEAMVRTLYALPFGTRLSSDGTWRVELR